MEKMMVYNLREFDEREFFTKYGKECGFEIVSTSESPSLENAYLAKDCKYVNIITTPINEELMKKFAENGMKYLVTRTIGYDHIDLEAAEKYGVKVANAPYGPDGVAEYSVMMMLMCIRNMKSIMHRFMGQDFTLKGLIGGELSSMTVGVIGTGRIGARVCEMLSGFGCKVLAYSEFKSEKAEKYAEYVDYETLLKNSDVITLHVPLTEKTQHMIGKKETELMKNGVVIVNTARGALIDTEAAVSALKSGKIGAMGLDVVENESSLFYYDLREEIIDHEGLYMLRSFPNVIMSHHMAFYTRQAVETMVAVSMKGAEADKNGEKNNWQVN